MKRRGGWLAVMGGAVMVGVMGYGQEAPKTEAPKVSAPSAPAAPGKSVTDSAGQAVVDSIKTPGVEEKVSGIVLHSGAR